MSRKTPVTALSLPVVVRDEINLVALDLSAEVGRRISMASVVLASLKVAKNHRAELIEILTAPDEGADE